MNKPFTRLDMTIVSRQVSRLVCRNVTCNRQGSPHCEGLCPQCYVSTNVATPARGSPARTVQQPAGTGLMVGSQAAAPMKSCIMDFCSNIGLTECKGLCEKCFAVVYQGRVLGDRTQTAAASQPLNGAIFGRFFSCLNTKLTRILRPAQTNAPSCCCDV